MRQILAYALLLLILGQSFSREVLVADFTLHRAAIAATECINRAVPGSDCGGSCYLRKQLRKQEKRENTASGAAREQLEMLPAARPWQPTPPVPAGKIAAEYGRPAPVRLVAGVTVGIFHPPLG